MSVMAVIDTNVLVSAFFKKSSIPAKILNEAISGRITPILQNEIIAEYEEVLCREKFDFPKNLVRETINQLKSRGVYFYRVKTNEHIPDPKDVVFYEVTMNAREESKAHLVTGNGKHFPTKPFVVTPSQMLEILENLE